MNDFEFICLLYAVFMIASLTCLPKWWKLASLPALYGAFMIEEVYRTGGGYMGDVFAAYGLIMICAWLGLVWLLLGIVVFSQWLCRGFQTSKGDDSSMDATSSPQTKGQS